MESAVREINDCESEIPAWVDDALNDDETDLFITTGGLGSGKTHGTAILVQDHLTLNSESRYFWCVAPTHRKTEDILIPSLQDALRIHYGLEPSIHYRIVKSPNWKIQFTCYKAPEIHFLSGDRPELFVGTQICGYWVTEPGIQKALVHEKCEDRLRCPKAKRLRAFMEGTPEGFNWYYELAENDTFERINRYTTRSVYKGDFGDNITATRFQLWTHDNRWINTEKYLTRLHKTYGNDKNRLHSYIYGEFRPFSTGNAYDFSSV